MSDDGTEIEVGSVAPDFSLEASEGSVVQLSAHRNRQYVVLYFMREFG